MSLGHPEQRQVLKVIFEVGRVIWLQPEGTWGGGKISQGKEGSPKEAGSWAPGGPSSEKAPVTKHIMKQQFWLAFRNHVDRDNDRVSGCHMA